MQVSSRYFLTRLLELSTRRTDSSETNSFFRFSSVRGWRASGFTLNVASFHNCFRRGGSCKILPRSTCLFCFPLVTISLPSRRWRMSLCFCFAPAFLSQFARFWPQTCRYRIFRSKNFFTMIFKIMMAWVKSPSVSCSDHTMPRPSGAPQILRFLSRLFTV